MLNRSFFPSFGQGPFPKIAGKALLIDTTSTDNPLYDLHVHVSLICLGPSFQKMTHHFLLHVSLGPTSLEKNLKPWICSASKSSSDIAELRVINRQSPPTILSMIYMYMACLVCFEASIVVSVQFPEHQLALIKADSETLLPVSWDHAITTLDQDIISDGSASLVCWFLWSSKIYTPVSMERSDQGSYSLIRMKGRLPLYGWLVGSIQTQQLTLA